MSYLQNQNRKRFWVLLVIVGCCAGLSSNVHAAGWFNMPTSFQQCFGYGYGPGYHSPMVLGPRLASGSEAKRIVYVPRAPISQPHGCFGESSYIEPIGGSMYHNDIGHSPSMQMMMPSGHPTLAPPAN